MTPKEIDKIFDAMKYGDDEYLWEVSKMSYTFSEENLKKYNDEFINRLGRIIEQGDFEYFLTKKNGSLTDREVFADLLSYTSKTEEMKKCIDERKELELDSLQVLNLIIGVNNPEYIKDCIENRRKELHLNSSKIMRLIKAINDPTYTKYCIDCRRKEFNIASHDITDLIISTKDPVYIKKCIENKREEFGLWSYEVKRLIIETKDPEYIKKCIDMREELGVSYLRKELIIETRDIEYIKDCIENRREELGLNSWRIVDLILWIKDSNYIEDCIDNRREELGLDFKGIFELIKEINDQDYKKDCIKNRREELGLDSVNIRDLIIGINEPDYAKYCIDQGEKIGIEDSELELLKIIYEEGYLDNILKNNISEKINLPPEMTIGIEIESIGENVDVLYKVNKQLLGNWTTKTDGSLFSDMTDEGGIEIVSPILTGSNIKTTNEIRRICGILDNFRNYTNDTCGGHIHIGADYLDAVNDWQNLLELWANTEKILYIIGNEKGSIPREEIVEYAGPISGELEDALNSGSINLDGEEGLENFKQQLLRFQEEDTVGRNNGINFMNIKVNSKKTIEFRLPNGTVNPNVWIQNINLFGGLVKASKELSTIQSKEESDLSEKEKKMLKCFENIKSNNLIEKEKLEALLEIVINEPDRDIYRERYKINKRLFEKNNYFERDIVMQTSRRPIIISRSKIGKKVFIGSDGIVGPEAEFVEQKINRDMENENEMNK